MTKAIEINCETGEVTERFLTEAEIAERELLAQKEEAERLIQETEAQAKAEAKISALAKLTKLGLTEEEASALIS